MIQEPTPLTPVTNGSEPGPGAGRPRAASNTWRLVVALVATLALVVTLLAAMSAAPQTSPLAAGASAEATATASTGTKSDVDEGAGTEKDHGNGWAKGLQKFGGQGRGLPFAVGGPRGKISITAIDGSDVSLATDDGWTRTIVITSDTELSKGGQSIAAKDLKVGDVVFLKQTRNDDGSFTVVAVVVSTPVTAGEVTAVAGSSITIKKRDGSSQVITVNGSTVYSLGGADASKSDVTVGAKIGAAGTESGSTFTALSVKIEPAHVDGLVTAKTADSITVTVRDGSSVVIHVSDKTVYKSKGPAAGSLADIAVGDRVQAQGKQRPNGSLDATSVQAKGPRGGWKGPKPDRQPDTDDAPTATTTPG